MLGSDEHSAWSRNPLSLTAAELKLLASVVHDRIVDLSAVDSLDNEQIYEVARHAVAALDLSSLVELQMRLQPS